MFLEQPSSSQKIEKPNNFKFLGASKPYKSMDKWRVGVHTGKKVTY